MSQFAVCVFPESVPREDQVAPLYRLWTGCPPATGRGRTPTAPSPAILELLQAGRLRLVTPVPLGDRRDRFLALVRDMAQRRDDYLSQLALLTLADLHRHSRPESGRSILSGLLGARPSISRRRKQQCASGRRGWC